MGRFESRTDWNRAAVIDMYRTDRQGYLGSFYVYRRGEAKNFRMLATDSYLYVLSGKELIRYRFAQAVAEQFHTGEAENLNPE